LGNDDPAKALAMDYLNDEFGMAALRIKRKNLQKKYLAINIFLKNEMVNW
jgi:hypothetical protein